MPVQKIDKNDFLLRCWEVFHLQGYYNTSMQDLAHATGLQKAGLYHHYATKHDLMQRVMEYALDAFRTYVLSVAEDNSLPPAQRLEKMLRRNKRLATLHRRGCFFANIALETARDELFNGILLQAMTEWKQSLAGILEHFMPIQQALQRAEQIIMEYEGAVLFYKLSNNEAYLEAMVVRAVQALGHQPHIHRIQAII